MTNIIRVYHPTLDAFEDVPESERETWKKAGWRVTKPDHVDDTVAVPVADRAPEIPAQQ